MKTSVAVYRYRGFESHPHRQLENKMPEKNYLALERTDLAIDRTLLAYLRTSLTIVVVGVSSIKFFNSPFAVIFGWILILAAIVLFMFGIKRCSRLRNKNNGK